MNQAPITGYDPAISQGAVPSPCNGVCRMNPNTKFCESCFRTLEEIVCWAVASESEKQAVWIEILRRKIPVE
jgi:predicted Fe-S protein YdhL (DUF1289 family)